LDDVVECDKFTFLAGYKDKRKKFLDLVKNQGAKGLKERQEEGQQQMISLYSSK